MRRVAGVLAAGRGAVAAGASAEEALWALWEATGLAERWAEASVAGGTAGAAADRDLDAVIALFDAAARFTDRLPGAAALDFYEHLAAQQVPGDNLAARGAAAEAVPILTAHAAKGLEWDLVVVAGVQEGVWPDLRRRGSLLGAELLVDLAAGRDGAGVSELAAQLAEERRLFYVAATRARERLVVTAVSGEDQLPSRFLDEIDPIDEGERPFAVVPGRTHLAALVAELRAVVCDPARPMAERAAAATELTRLAAAEVPGAHPDQWWGLAPPSDTGPVADPDRPVTVSPSRLESFGRCELRAVLAQLGARDDQAAGASLGTVLHEVAAIAPPDADQAVLEGLLEQRWSRLDFGAAWLAANERDRAGEMLAKLAAWLRASRDGLALAAIEEEFDVIVGDARLRGRVDRLERDAAGQLVVVDLKTGKIKPKADELPTNPQLGAYQLAVAAGGFNRHGAVAGGARLVQLGTATKKYDEQKQAPLAEAAEPDWVTDQVAGVAARMRGGEFTARQNEQCRVCEVRGCCPLRPEGGQVTG
ncbi:MAG: PD-(D/E)XK nuclease family protein [Actinomycetia bacterium]|nr:PD-(D/E)XK nuclease family protein [Actinomycetes bacterium]